MKESRAHIAQADTYFFRLIRLPDALEIIVSDHVPLQACDLHDKSSHFERVQVRKSFVLGVMPTDQRPNVAVELNVRPVALERAPQLPPRQAIAAPRAHRPDEISRDWRLASIAEGKCVANLRNVQVAVIISALELLHNLLQSPTRRSALHSCAPRGPAHPALVVHAHLHLSLPLPLCGIDGEVAPDQRERHVPGPQSDV